METTASSTVDCNSYTFAKYSTHKFHTKFIFDKEAAYEIFLQSISKFRILT